MVKDKKIKGFVPKGYSPEFRYEVAKYLHDYMAEHKCSLSKAARNINGKYAVGYTNAIAMYNEHKDQFIAQTIESSKKKIKAQEQAEKATKPSLWRRLLRVWADALLK